MSTTGKSSNGVPTSGGAPAGLEIVRPAAGRRFEFALFDFDGTLSLLREGWPDVMIPMMEEYFSSLSTGLSPEQVRQMLRDDVLKLTGQQTIYQMIKFADRVREYGGQPLAPKAYKAEYNRRLLERIEHRRQALRSGQTPPDRLLLPGTRKMLQTMVDRGLTLCVASGTDEQYVFEEARLLDVERYFGKHIYGAQEDYEHSSKRKVIERLIKANGIRGERLLGFGDGFVEIEDTKAVGGYAIGVASDEGAGGGKIDAWKRNRLLQAGADVIIPDFSCLDELMKQLFG